MSSNFISRLAPTPSGYLHFGNAFNFLLTYLLVNFNDGVLHLRIDDLDGPRVDHKFVEDIFIQLEWLGLDYDSGPQGPDEHLKLYSQKFRIENYLEALSSLREIGSLYACRCSRKQYLAISEDGLYPKTCRNKNLDLEQPEVTWRFKSDSVAKSNKDSYEAVRDDQRFAKLLGDAVLLRRNGSPSYQIGSLVDDMIDRPNLIVRGADLYPSSMFQISMAEKLGWTFFPDIFFIHHSLLKDSTGKKFAKSEGAYSLKDLKQDNADPSFIYRGVASWLGLPDSNVHDLKSLQDVFSTISLNQFLEMNLEDYPVK